MLLKCYPGSVTQFSGELLDYCERIGVRCYTIYEGASAFYITRRCDAFPLLFKSLKALCV